MKLTNTACNNAKPKAKSYKLADGGGLYLLVSPNGSKYWRLKYRYLGKEKVLALGIYPLSAVSGVSRGMIASIESGHKQSGIGSLRKLARALK